MLMNAQGTVKLSDFGISRKVGTASACHTFVGTSTHMSPERMRGEDYSFPADIWSIGLCAYELASGNSPFKGTKNYLEIFNKICSAPEPRLPADDEYSASLC